MGEGQHGAGHTLHDGGAKGSRRAAPAPMVQAVVCRTAVCGSLSALSRNGRPIATRPASLSGGGPSRIEPNANVAASRNRQSSGASALPMFTCGRAGRAGVRQRARARCAAPRAGAAPARLRRALPVVPGTGKHSALRTVSCPHTASSPDLYTRGRAQAAARWRPGAASALPRVCGTGEHPVCRHETGCKRALLASARPHLCQLATCCWSTAAFQQKCKIRQARVQLAGQAPAQRAPALASHGARPGRGCSTGRGGRRAAPRACTNGMTSAMTSWPTTLATSVRQVPPAIARFHAPSSRSCARAARRAGRLSPAARGAGLATRGARHSQPPVQRRRGCGSHAPVRLGLRSGFDPPLHAWPARIAQRSPARRFSSTRRLHVKGGSELPPEASNSLLPSERHSMLTAPGLAAHGPR